MTNRLKNAQCENCELKSYREQNEDCSRDTAPQRALRSLLQTGEDGQYMSDFGEGNSCNQARVVVEGFPLVL